MAVAPDYAKAKVRTVIGRKRPLGRYEMQLTPPSAGKYTRGEMISNHLKKGLWLWGAACVVLWGLSKQPQFQQLAQQMARIDTFPLWGGAAVLLIALLIVSYVENSRAAKRMTELHRRVESGETIDIRGGSGLTRLIVMLTFAGVVLAAVRAKGPPFLFELYVAAAVPLVFLELLTVIPLLRQPIPCVSARRHWRTQCSAIYRGTTSTASG